MASRGRIRTGERPAKGGTQFWTHDGKMLRSCVLSDDKVHRYSLGRRWAPRVDGDQVCWVLLNPSVADGTRDDMTATKCIKFAQRWGYNAIVIVNCFAFRATHPDQLPLQDDPVGPHNVEYVKHAIARSAVVVVGWGGNPHDRSPVNLKEEEYRQGKEVFCLGRTNKGRPRHPSRLAYETERESY